MQIALSGQANILELPIVAKATGSPITSGVVRFYVVDKDGANANKWYRGSDGTWQVAESIAAVATHRADGHWYKSLPSVIWENHKRYSFYAKESGSLHIPVGDDTFVNATVRTAIAVVGQANVLTLTLLAKASGNAITSGTINFYLFDKDGPNVGKYYNADGSWTVGVAVAGVATHRADGHWYHSFPSAVWDKNTRYRFYAKEGGDLHIPIGMDILADTLTRVTEGSEKLQASPASIIKTYIIEETSNSMTDPSDGSTWPLFVNALPDGKPSEVETEAGAVFDTPGIQDLRDMTGAWPEHPGIQIRIRARTYETAYAKIEAIANDLDKVKNDTIVIGSLQYKIGNLKRTSPILNLGMEQGTKRRFNLVINFLLTIREMTT